MKTRFLHLEPLERRDLLSADFAPPEPAECVAGSRMSRACDVGEGDVSGTVHRRSRSAFYRFELDERQQVQVQLAGMSGNADLYLLNANGKTLASSRSRGTSPESIDRLLQSGTYHIRVYAPSFRTSTAFDLAIDLEVWNPVDDATRQAIVATALAELGRTARQVGMDRDEWPGPLSDSLVGRNPPWCSEFVSWTYASAGEPFSGGSHGGWMLNGWPQVIRYFSNAGLYVKKGTAEWKTLDPQPGDYIHMKGHSAMVLDVDGDRLITIEGNVRGRVVSREFNDWRNSRIVGIGMLGYDA